MRPGTVASSANSRTQLLVVRGADWWLPSRTCCFLQVCKTFADEAAVADLMAFLRFCLISLNVSTLEPSVLCSELRWSKRSPVYYSHVWLFVARQFMWETPRVKMTIYLYKNLEIGREFPMEAICFASKYCASQTGAWHLIRFSQRCWERIDPTFPLHGSGHNVMKLRITIRFLVFFNKKLLDKSKHYLYITYFPH